MQTGQTGGRVMEGSAPASAAPGRGEEMARMKLRRIDVSGWSLEQVHDILHSQGRDGWELAQVMEPSEGRMVLCLVLREVA